ncbi:hypothetical protein [Nocardioides sp. NPDC127503]|uniref:hypothetical protein n=1 Tax=Nocardioides sp. NPDC127503 TaxID=3154516 RepID=UPI00331BCA8C
MRAFAPVTVAAPRWMLDRDGTLRRAKEMGGEAVVPPTEIPVVGFFAMFRDPGGNIIGVFPE